MRRVAITGMGIVSPIGNRLEDVRTALTRGISGVRHMAGWEQVQGLRCRVAGPVEGIDPAGIARRYRRTMGRMAVFGTFAAQDAVAQAGLAREDLETSRTGLVIGSTTGSVPSLSDYFSAYGARGILEQEGTAFIKVMSHTVAANVAAVLGVKGRVLAPCSACASSTQAIGMGFEMIRDGWQDIVLCGGADDLHPTTAGVFDVLHAASKRFNDSPQKTPRPFDRDRDGVVVSEGAAVVVLEAYDRAVARGARIYGELVGYATGCDAQHMTSPSVDGMVRCMLEALNVAGVDPADLSYVNAHATGTETGDAAEAAALRELVGERVPVSGTKGYTGHTLAACGAMELIFCLLMMQHGFLAPTLNLEAVGEDCGGLAHVLELRPATPALVMTSNFAFGGINASLILKRAYE